MYFILMPDATMTSTKELFHAVFPALVIGLFAMFAFMLFAQVLSDAGSNITFFTNTAAMALFGFFVGFAGRLAIVFEKYL
jgi:hypothetical protein